MTLTLKGRTWDEAALDITAAEKAYALALIAEAPNTPARVRAVAQQFTEVYREARNVRDLFPAEAFQIAADAIREHLTAPATAQESRRHFAKDEQA